MLNLSITQNKSFLRTLAERFIDSYKLYGVIKPLQFFLGGKYYRQKLAYMRELPVHTVGYELAQILDRHQLQLIPKFEEHDLKHLILGYGMSTEEELGMQAYLLGNGSRKLSCILFLSSAILLPSLWRYLYQEFKKGRSKVSIRKISLYICMHEPLSVIRKKYTKARFPKGNGPSLRFGSIRT